MAKTIITVEIEVTSGSPLSTHEIDELKDAVVKTVFGIPMLPQGAHSQSRSVTAKSVEEKL
jgi:hypothetical protein